MLARIDGHDRADRPVERLGRIDGRRLAARVLKVEPISVVFDGADPSYVSPRADLDHLANDGSAVQPGHGSFALTAN